MISIAIPDFRGGGAERVVIDLAREFNNLGHIVEFILMNARGEFLDEARLDFSVVELGVQNIRQIPLPLAKYLNSRAPDVLIANMWPLTSAVVLARLLSKAKTRLLLVEHAVLSRQYASWGGMHNLAMRASMWLTYRMADRVAAVSDGAARDIARLAGLTDGLVEVLHNPIPRREKSSKQRLDWCDEFWGCAPGGRILTVGRLKEEKNHSLLIRAFSKLARNNARLMILGAGDAASLSRLASDSGVAGRVLFPGFHIDPSPFYQTADLFVLSSDYEGFGNVIVEALSFGVPVVSTDCEYGPDEILGHGRFGTLVPVRNPEALAAAMDCALNTPVDRSLLMNRADDFAPEIAARKYLRVLGLS